MGKVNKCLKCGSREFECIEVIKHLGSSEGEENSINKEPVIFSQATDHTVALMSCARCSEKFEPSLINFQF